MVKDIYWYSMPDTECVTWFDGIEVPTINETCYSTEDGEINIMFAPVNNMAGDTVTISAIAEFADGYRSSKELNIILQ